MEIVKAVNAALYSLWEFYLLWYLIRAGRIIKAYWTFQDLSARKVLFFMLQIPIPPIIPQFLKTVFKSFYFSVQPYNYNYIKTLVQGLLLFFTYLLTRLLKTNKFHTVNVLVIY